ncbi:MAG: OadG family protein [Candidatus Delongbacteria bacterium]|nr:OadG family protein [Candidatus Delongbacteria bacterium]MBN2835759.1 OadG family protein [Candidatus Delongbacteria bacterium]
MTGMENVLEQHGLLITFSGMAIVFLGLILIAVAVTIFNKIFARDAHKAADTTPKHVNIYDMMKKESDANVPEEDLVAITTALEIYQRLYGFEVSSKLTFDRSRGVGQPKLKNIFAHRNV